MAYNVLNKWTINRESVCC